jgi:hypothetical protein
VTAAKNGVSAQVRNQHASAAQRTFIHHGGDNTMHMRQAISLALCFCLGMALYPPLATAAYDGSVPLLCSVIEVFDCQAGSDCQPGTAESVNLPQFIKVDFAKKTLSTPEEGGSKRITPITYVERVNGDMILQGVEGSRAWSMVIANETGKISATVSDHQVGFVVFGACIPF